MTLRPTRRGLLLGLAASAALGRARIAFARTEGNRRLVVVILQGALDGLFAVQPYGDAALAGLRAPLVLPEPGQEGGLLDLGGFFGLHPAMPALHALYAAGEAAVLHAVAGPWRSRSHFEAQDFLESGGAERLTSGWLNRALAALPNSAEARAGIAIGPGMPLLLRGPVPVGAYAPPGLERPPLELIDRIAELQAADPLLAPVLAEGLRARDFVRHTLGASAAEDRERRGFVRLAAAAGRLLAATEGPRVAAMELGGWDTHAAQPQRLVPMLRTLDEGLAALKEGLGPAWPQTAVLVVTEFGRTARVNGNTGTDHGTGGAAFLLGGAVAGGRVIADWPGLGEGRLLEDRDLMPTLDLRRIAKGLLRDHLRLPEAAVARAFPDSADAPALAGLVRA